MFVCVCVIGDIFVQLVVVWRVCPRKFYSWVVQGIVGNAVSCFWWSLMNTGCEHNSVVTGAPEQIMHWASCHRIMIIFGFLKLSWAPWNHAHLVQLYGNSWPDGTSWWHMESTDLIIQKWVLVGLCAGAPRPRQIMHIAVCCITFLSLESYWAFLKKYPDLCSSWIGDLLYGI